MNGPDFKARLLSQAEIDITEGTDYIAKDSLDAALRFFDSVYSAVAFLCEHPEAGGVPQWFSPSLAETRVWPIKGFENWLIIYQISKPEIVVLRIVHGARDLDFLFR